MKKIMFNDKYCLMLAVLNGTKTMTRRVLKDDVPLGNWEETVKHLPYKVGEVVAIAQSYKDIYDEKCIKFGKAEANIWWYDVIGTAIVPQSKKAGYVNKMFVKAGLMAHHIKITDVKVERLQDISKEDCLKEGIIFIEPLFIGDDAYFFAVKRKVGQMYDNILKFFSSPQRAYADLIDKISGKGTWESNPWVVTYEFKLID